MRHIDFRCWRSGTELDQGAHDGTAVRDGVLVMTHATAVREYDDPHTNAAPVTYEQATWTSPEVLADFPVTEIIPSWNARTPEGTWIEVTVSATLDDGSETCEYVLGRWAETHHDIHPTSVPGQSDEHASVAVDMLTAEPPRTFASHRIRVHLLRQRGSEATPTVSLVGAMTSNVPHAGSVPASHVDGAAGTLIDVPAYSQQLHRGQFPQWGNGGESWCSPTSTSMVLAHWGLGPDPEEYAWIDDAYPDPFVAYAAKHVYDHGYQGPGNWSFNTAYAARFGVTSYVTRLRSLAEAEKFVALGIPLVVSVSFTEDQLAGAGYGTEGHLLTIVGFTEDGDVVCNDPASHVVPSNDEVRTTYAREQFESAWLLPTGGVTYVIHPPEVELPERTTPANW